MKSFTATSLALLALFLSVYGTPTPSTLIKASGPVKPDSYIVVLKANVNQANHLSSLAGIATQDAAAYQEVTHLYDTAFFNGYAGILRGAALDHVLNSKDVDFVEQDSIASIKHDDRDESFSAEILDGRDLVETQGTTGGYGVDVYGIDTGVYTGHVAFTGRVSWGATFGGYASKDGNGHGTHTMATAIGTKYGFATRAKGIAIKVLSDAGSGWTSDVISGVNFAYVRARASRRPSVVNMSLGGGLSTALNAAVSNAISGGLHFTIAAGNSNVDARITSPASVSTANTVGAIDSKNAKAYFSNYGAILDVWAPGVSILSAYIGAPTATAVLSGTSMAAPYVAGIIAVVLGEYGSVTPATMSSNLKLHAKKVVTGAPLGTTTLKATLW
ncbi:hypothetical protein BS47DRAFT_1311408 [Hydnum rufescens UP504]|uniref:Uncharacterized protein n=1 Tax=Hydnum rufescens UP504 TaxID=1448309 RepID=A0A9P6DZF6_9AGAM|nr:hypothetical protein BS47DRAFT_1311408 [Hydnum rufescens UP504]